MSKDMLGIAVRKLVTLPVEVLGIVCDLLEKLADPEWVGALKRFLRKENPWLKTSDLLELVAEVELPRIDNFIANERFRCRVDTTAEVPIGSIGNEFEYAFFFYGGRVETDIAAATLRTHKPKENSLDGSIITELGGEEVAETTLAQMFCFMKKQGRPSHNVTFNFFIRVKGVIERVWCSWYTTNGYWSVGVSSAKMLGWDNRHYFVSH